jgi:hypothetical protein
VCVAVACVNGRSEQPMRLGFMEDSGEIEILHGCVF